MMILALAAFFAGCGNRSDDDGIIVIGDRFFIHQVQDIFMNTQQYLGRTIRYEGIFRILNWPPEYIYYHFVIRYAASCCTREPIGFFIRLPDYLYPIPPDNAWVEITGVLEIYDYTVPMINAISLIEMEERGFTFVW